MESPAVQTGTIVGDKIDVATVARPPTPPAPSPNNYQFDIPVPIGNIVLLAFSGYVNLTTLEMQVSVRLDPTPDHETLLASASGSLDLGTGGLHLNFDLPKKQLQGQAIIFFQIDSTTTVNMVLMVMDRGYYMGPGMMPFIGLPATTPPATTPPTSSVS